MCLYLIFGDAFALGVHHTKVALRVHISLLGKRIPAFGSYPIRAIS